MDEKFDERLTAIGIAFRNHKSVNSFGYIASCFITIKQNSSDKQLNNDITRILRGIYPNGNIEGIDVQ